MVWQTDAALPARTQTVLGHHMLNEAALRLQIDVWQNGDVLKLLNRR